MELLLNCPKCQNNIDITDFFCRVCGLKRKETTISISFLKQLSIYLTSFFLPPFGLIPAIKYLRQEDDKAKLVGIIAVFITIISVIFSIWLMKDLMNTFNKILN